MRDKGQLVNRSRGLLRLEQLEVKAQYIHSPSFAYKSKTLDNVQSSQLQGKQIDEKRGFINVSYEKN